MKIIRADLPTEKEISSLLDNGAEIEIYMKDGKNQHGNRDFLKSPTIYLRRQGFIVFLILF